MKKQISFLVIILISSIAISQTLVDTNKLWSTVIHRLPSFTIITEYIKIEQDTIIDLENYKKVFRSTDEFQTSWLPYGYIRETIDKEVYYRTDTSLQESLIYDFGANINDTLYIAGITSFGSNWYFNSMQFIVCEIDSILIGGNYKRQFHMNPIFGDTMGCGIERWVEGIGSLSGLLHFTNGTVGGDSFDLLCFSENDTLKYQNPSYNSCYILTNVEDAGKALSNISIFPNPTTGLITIEADGIKRIEVLDITGKNLTGFENLLGLKKIDLIQEPQGIYFIKITTDKETVTRKIIKQ